MGLVRWRSMATAVLLALAACGSDEGGGSTGNICVPDSTTAACQECLDYAHVCTGEGICREQSSSQWDCKFENCTGDHYRTLKEKYECQLEFCSEELRALQACMDSNCRPGRACVGSF